MNGPYVLLVDQDRAFLSAASRVLAAAGFPVGWARSSDEAIEKLAGLHPDVVILDLKTLGDDGLGEIRRVSRAVKRMNGGSRNPRVFVLHNGKARPDIATRVEIDGFVSKAAFSTVVRALGRNRARKRRET